MNIKDYKHSTWNQISDNSVVFILSDKDDGLVQQIKESGWEGISESHKKMLTTAEKVVKAETKEHGVPHYAFTFPDDGRSSKALFIFPAIQDPNEIEFKNPNMMPKYEDLDDHSEAFAI